MTLLRQMPEQNCVKCPNKIASNARKKLRQMPEKLQKYLRISNNFSTFAAKFKLLSLWMDIKPE